MDGKKFDIKQFEMYLEELMSETEKSVFEAELENDPTLAANFHRYKQLKYFISDVIQDDVPEDENEAFDQLGEEIDSILDKYKPSVSINSKHQSLRPNIQEKAAQIWKSLFSRRQMVLGSCVVLLGGLFFYYSWLSSSCDANKMFEQAVIDDFGTYEFEAALSEGTENNLKKEARNAYNSGDYVMAQTKIAAYLAERTDYEAQIFWGLCYLRVGEADQAIKVLAEVDEYQVAIWLTALAQLKLGAYDDLEITLAKVIRDDAKRRKKAQGIMDKLDCLKG